MKKQAGFDSVRVHSLLGHIATLREAQRVIKQEYPDFVESVLRDVRRTLRAHQETKRWRFFPEEDEILGWISLAPGVGWRVVKLRGEEENNYVQIEVTFDECKPLEAETHPEVALFTPEGWRLEPKFRNQLHQNLPRSVKGWVREQRKGFTPLWTPIPYEDHIQGIQFDRRAFTEALVDAVLALVRLRPKIDRVLRSLRSPRVGSRGAA